MRRIRSRLQDSGLAILVVATVSLLLAICVCVLLPRHMTPRYGVQVRPEGSRFVMGAYDRTNTHIISVAAGDEYRFYEGAELIPGGLRGFEERMEQWQTGNPAQTTVVLVADKAAPSGVVQQLIDRVLARGFNCNYAAVPAWD
ncbi:MAG: hypothetical protein ACI4OS_06970 [Akkermansia sp.]